MLESVRTLPVPAVAFAHAKIVHVMAGQTHIRTSAGERILTAGEVMVLGAGVWCAAVPAPRVRTWTIYLNQAFLQQHMLWALPGPERVRPGFHPTGWDGQGLFFRSGGDVLSRMEPLLRRMSVVSHRPGPETVASLMAMFAQTVEFVVPALVTDTHGDTPAGGATVGRLTGPLPVPEVTRAAELLRGCVAHPWTVAELAAGVVLSRSQLNRRFVEGLGLAPMRWLTELRITEFARLIEETTLPVDAAARRVGWEDRRVAAYWFRRRYGTSPTDFRRFSPLNCAGESPCVLCRNDTCIQIIT